ncbi:MAG: dTDP-4-dehydrorhamnose 3,5-epimerase family protein [Chthoniobacterales bacterium]
MIFTETPFKGAFLIDLEPRLDKRGFFARSYCRREFEAKGLNLAVVQSNLSFNLKAGTLRGMHFRKDAPGEAKLVRCMVGAIFDVIIDLRPQSPTYRQYFATELTADNHRALFIPAYFAQGFQALTDNTLVEYQMGEYYAADLAAGFRYDDPAFAIRWPRPAGTISEQDLAWPRFIP